MLTRFLNATGMLKKASSRALPGLFLIIMTSFSTAKAGDVPIDRNFMKIPDGRWVWMHKIGVHETQMMLGKGAKSVRNAIWSRVYETDGDKHVWCYAFFIKLKNNKFLIRDSDNSYRFAISTYDFGTGMFRWAIVYRIKSDALEVVEEIKGFNVAGDENLYQ